MNLDEPLQQHLSDQPLGPKRLLNNKHNSVQLTPALIVVDNYEGKGKSILVTLAAEIEADRIASMQSDGDWIDHSAHADHSDYSDSW